MIRKLIWKYSFLFLSFLVWNTDAFAQQWGNYTLVAIQNKTTVSLIDNSKAAYKTWTLSGNTGYSAYMLPGGTLARSVTASNSTFNVPATTGRFQKVAFDGTLLWDYTYSSSSYQAHHDFHVMPNGNLLLIAYTLKTAAEATAAGLSTSKIIYPERVVEIKQTGATTGEVVWQWDVWDHLVQEANAAKANYGVVADHPELLDLNYKNTGTTKDWIHANGIDYNPVLDQIVFSSHYLNEIYVIDHSTTTAEAASHKGGKYGKGGDFLYRWGNPAAYKATGTTNFNVLHDAHWIPNDTPDAGFIAAFNNGGTTSYSTVDKVKPAFDGSTYTLAPNTYLPATNSGRLVCSGKSTNMGSSQQLPNGNQLVCVATSGLIYEVDPTGKTIWSYQASGTTPQSSRYSACFIDGSSPVPTITASNASLTSSTATSYQWYLNGVAIAGETNQTLTATKSGKYQVMTKNANGCSSPFSLVYSYEGVVSTHQIDDTRFLSLYPNPTDGILNLSGDVIADANATLKIFSQDGKVVLISNAVPTLDLSNFSNGIYFLQIQNKTGVATRKIVKN